MSKIRALLGLCFPERDDPRERSAEEDYHEAVLAMRALKSLFERELDSRTAERSDGRVVPHDREM